MKKILAILTIVLVMFASCDSGDFVGGRYFGTFHNTMNGMGEVGSLSFQFGKVDENTCMLFNNIVSMTQVDNKKYTAISEGAQLRDLLKTIPAIDSIKVCDSTETIRLLTVETEFKGNSVKADMTFTTTNENIVLVEFVGGFE
jgi:hypothetical protein